MTEVEEQSSPPGSPCLLQEAMDHLEQEEMEMQLAEVERLMISERRRRHRSRWAESSSSEEEGLSHLHFSPGFNSGTSGDGHQGPEVSLEVNSLLTVFIT